MSSSQPAWIEHMLQSASGSTQPGTYSTNEMLDIYNKLAKNNVITIDKSAAQENSARASHLATPSSVELLNSKRQAPASTQPQPHAKAQPGVQPYVQLPDLTRTTTTTSTASPVTQNTVTSSTNATATGTPVHSFAESLNLPDLAGVPLLNLVNPSNVSWFYTDLNNTQQGPFDSLTMQQWYQQNLLNQNLTVRRDIDTNWLTIADLWKRCKALENFSIELAPFNQPLPSEPLTSLPLKAMASNNRSTNSILPTLTSFNSTSSIFGDSSTHINQKSSFFNNDPSIATNARTHATAAAHANVNADTMGTASGTPLDSRSNSNFDSAFANQLNLNNLNSLNGMMNYLSMDMNNLNMNPLSPINNHLNFNPMDPMNPMSHMSQMGTMNQVNQVNQMNHMNQMNNLNHLSMNDLNNHHMPLNSLNNYSSLNHLNSIGTMDPINSLNMNHINSMNSMNSFMDPYANPLNPLSINMDSRSNSNMMDHSLSLNLEMQNFANNNNDIQNNLTGQIHTSVEDSAQLQSQKISSSKADTEVESKDKQPVEVLKVEESKATEVAKVTDTADIKQTSTEATIENFTDTLQSSKLEISNYSTESKKSPKATPASNNTDILEKERQNTHSDSEKTACEKSVKKEHSSEGEKNIPQPSQAKGEEVADTKKAKSVIAPWASVSQNIKPTKTLEEIQKEEKIKKEREMAERRKLEENDRLLASRLALEDTTIPIVNINNKKNIVPLSSLATSKSSVTLPSNSTWAINGVSSPKLPSKSLDEIKKEELKLAREQANALAAVKQQKTIAEAIAHQHKNFATSIANENLTSSSNDNAWQIVNKKEKPKTPTVASPVGMSVQSLNHANLTPTTLRSISSSNPNTTQSPTPTSASASMSFTPTTSRSSTPVYTAPAVPSVTPSFPTPVIEFLSWSRHQLSGLYRSVNKEDVLQIMMQLPVGSESQEIIADTVYSNSSTMDGRRFATEFMRKRGKIEDTIKRRGWAFDWFEALEGTKNMKPTIATVASSQSNDDDWDGAFTVVSRKKGRKGN